MIKNKDLKQRILEISYKHKLSHIGSCLTAVDIIDEIYLIKKDNEPFILSSGHAGLALYVVLEKYHGLDAEKLFEFHGVHPSRNEYHRIYCSTGSLGQGITVAVGRALADRSRKVYCLISDGESAEGAVYEALNVAEDQRLSNLIIFINYNSMAAYRSVEEFKIQFLPFHYAVSKTNTEEFPFLKGQDAHYHVMTEGEYKLGMEILK